MMRLTRPAAAALAGAVLLIVPAGPAAAGASHASPAAGQAATVSERASVPHRPDPVSGCHNFGHWVSALAHGVPCEDLERTKQDRT